MTEILAILLIVTIDKPALLEVLPPLVSELHLAPCYDGRERPDPSGWP